jgi:hypothetical protein
MSKKMALAGLILAALVFCGTLPVASNGPQSGVSSTDTSGVFQRVKYDEASRVLRLRFSNGYDYEYRDVPPEFGYDFVASSSKGYYFNRFIRGKFETKRLLSGARQSGS